MLGIGGILVYGVPSKKEISVVKTANGAYVRRTVGKDDTMQGRPDQLHDSHGLTSC